MKKIIIFSLILAIVFCKTMLLDTQYPYPSQNLITFKLDDSFKTNATLNQIGKLQMQMNLYSAETYFTSPDCVNCQIYGTKNSKPFICNKEEYCTEYYSIDGSVDQYFKARGSIIDMNLVLDSTEFYLSQGMYVKWISQLQLNQTYQYQGIGLVLTRSVQCTFLRSLYNQAKIDNYSYSFYYAVDSYNLIIGGYNQSLLAQEFYNLKSVSIMRNIPYKIIDDMVLADLYFNKQIIQKDAQIVLDPTIDGIVLPTKLSYDIQNILLTQRNLPDISQFTPEQPGIWSSLKTAPSFQIQFQLDDPDAISQYLQVNFDAQTLNAKNQKGQFTPRISFVQILDQNNQYYNVTRVGKILFQQMMYYKYIQDGGQSIATEFRGLAPIIKIQKQ
ncbi:hypothetical protein ABPG72_003333 [Tetrahymena utriculariae]